MYLRSQNSSWPKCWFFKALRSKNSAKSQSKYDSYFRTCKKLILKAFQVMVYSFNNTFINSLFRYMFFLNSLLFLLKMLLSDVSGFFRMCSSISMGYWPSMSSRWLDISQVFCVCVCFMDWDETKKRARLISSYPEQTSLFFKGFSMLQKDITLIRIKNNLFISRARKERQLCLRHNKPMRLV